MGVGRGSPGATVAVVLEQAGEAVLEPRTVVLVEGRSDQLAVTALAERLDRDLPAERVAVIAMHGATNIGHFLQRYGPPGLGLRLAGLCDANEVRFFARGLARAGLGGLGGLGEAAGREQMEARQFFVCDADLEDELIRALGTAVVERVLGEHGDLRSFRTLQRQPAQRGRPDQARLRRFLGSGSGRKIRYAPILVSALPLTAVPEPLSRLLSVL
jgi:hypothetical protein